MEGRRVSRRAFVSAAAATGAVAAAGGAIGLHLTRNGEDGSPSPAGNPEATPPGTITAVPTPTSGPSPTPLPRGGTAIVVSPAGFSFDTFDAVLSGEPSIVEVLGRTHRRLVDWTSFQEGELGPAMARSWEQAGPSTWVFDIAPASWSAAEGLPERPVTAEDAAAHLNRLLDGARSGEMALSQRPWNYDTIERVEAPGDGTLVVETSRPDPFLLQTLAGRFALIQRPESVEEYGDSLNELRPEHISGSGPFTYTGFESGRLAFQAREGGSAHLDGLVVAPGGGDLQAFLRGDLHEYIARDRRDAHVVREEFGDAVDETGIFEDSLVVSAMAVGVPPWNDPGLRLALSGALNRGWLADQMFGGRAVAAGILAPSTARIFGAGMNLGDDLPGYREDSAADAADAQARWQAAGGPALGPIEVDFPAIFDPIYAASAIVTSRLQEVLGNEVRPAVVSYGDISGRVGDGYYGNGRLATWFGWGNAVPSPDPSRWLREAFSSDSATARAAGYTDDNVDMLLEQLASEFDTATRADVARQIEQALLSQAGGGYLPWVLQRSERFTRATLRGRVGTPFWGQHLDAGIYLRP